ncbi:hypothetical protein JTE90_012230 [Oedothorax gibbosus]|uniref:Uncharacterized protein n=1 Tax=Oedothorax gibbosus TaxID=931172 RepID=A0AAV6UX79_9ARAC|nr:hypothetical protein JTE90_012230 [Oedothorax gibbosus]
MPCFPYTIHQGADSKDANNIQDPNKCTRGLQRIAKSVDETQNSEPGNGNSHKIKSDGQIKNGIGLTRVLLTFGDNKNYNIFYLKSN